MKKLEEFVSEINEGRRPGSKNRPKDIDVPGAPDIDKLDGKPASKHGEGEEFGINEPKDKKAKQIEDEIDLDDPNNTQSVKQLISKFDTEEDFFIEGRAGWGKTSIIEKLARQYGYEIITVYLDKSDPEELGGYNVPVEANKSKAKVKDELGRTVEREFAANIKALPSWAKTILDNPDVNFLLFFDEMNQAVSQTMNALMPIILEHRICGIDFNNFFVGAAGNLEEENRTGVNTLEKPLALRLKPIIKWVCDWKETFRYLHKKWDPRLGKDFVDMFEAAALDGAFDNPRGVERQVFKYVEKLKNKGAAVAKRVDPELYKYRLEELAAEKVERHHIDKTFPKLAEAMAAIILNKPLNNSRRNGKDREGIPENIKSFFKNGIKRGYLEPEGDDHQYGISKENIKDVIAEITKNENKNGLNGEMIQIFLDKLEADGVEFKYKTDQEWRDEGFTDPLKALIIDKNTKEKPIKVKRYEDR